jgi:hypothetical protein
MKTCAKKNEGTRPQCKVVAVVVRGSGSPTADIGIGGQQHVPQVDSERFAREKDEDDMEPNLEQCENKEGRSLCIETHVS